MVFCVNVVVYNAELQKKDNTLFSFHAFLLFYKSQIFRRIKNFFIQVARLLLSILS